ncbi:MAG: carbohydrate ABC transporter permease [Butyrivibrio sp.]|uniref:carbohydrate ABC transporter permease n=1 Tax=Butyrivibrio sp. TaxID=28121 RepID=UPI0025BD21B5|nr:carbohydrate ABC transporter permease [Butyrivibrio sp.]MBQ6589733.1 carbohydrate ABC transporter permease [Butyrivibrio sp.]
MDSLSLSFKGDKAKEKTVFYTPKENKIKSSIPRKIFVAFNYTLLTALAIAFILPVMHVFFSSISDPYWLNTKSGLVLAPHGINFTGYQLVFNNKDLVRGFGNTIIYVTVATVLGMLITIIGAYVLSRRDLLFADVLMMLISFTMIFGGGIVPSYIIMQKLHLLNTRWAVILPACVSTYNLIIMRTAFSTVPPALEESARLDGAGDLTVIFQVLLPLVKASVATIALYYIIAHWNSWFQASMYLQNRELFPLQLVLREILIVNDANTAASMSTLDAVSDANAYKQLVKYAVIIVSSAPMIAVYPFVMKYFESGVMIGAVKG